MKRSNPVKNPELALSRILARFDSGDRHELASDLHHGFRLLISESYPAQLKVILGRDLSKEESFMVGVLHRIAVLQGFDGAVWRRKKLVTKRAKKVVTKAVKKARRR